MVAETHNHHDRIDPDDVVSLLVADADHDDPRALTLRECGFEGELGLCDLLALLAEEYGERALPPIAVEDLDSDLTIAELVALLAIVR